MVLANIGENYDSLPKIPSELGPHTNLTIDGYWKIMSVH